MRIGHGFSALPFQPGEKIMLGGVVIAYHCGLSGPGDGDVLLLSIGDALLGAVGLGSCATEFPRSNPDFRFADSRSLLRMIGARLKKLGHEICNIDASVITRDIQLQTYLSVIKQGIAEDLAIDTDSVNLKLNDASCGPIAQVADGLAAFSTVLIKHDY